MAQQFWHNLIIEKSFLALQELARSFKFTLIGGWAVYFYTKTLKSKDIDIIVDFEELGELKRNFTLIKNERLKKYEIRGDGFDIDIYVSHFSALGLPLDYVIKNTTTIEGFKLPKKEILLALKLFVYKERKGSLRGKKDMIDIVSLLYKNKISLSKFMVLLKKFKLDNLAQELIDILITTFEVKELNINRKQFSDFKKPILEELKESGR